MWYTPRKTIEEYLSEPPIIVGGIRGSGTRVVAMMTEACGVYMGYRDYFIYLHNTWDAPGFHTWSGRAKNDHVNEIYLPPEAKQNRKEALEVTIEMHLKYRQDEKFWGWKDPDAVEILPLLHTHFFPNMKFIHVIRDGRDSQLWWKGSMTHSSFYRELIPEEMYNNPDEINFMWVWNLFNNRAADYGENEMGKNYLRMRLEDIVEDWEEYTKKIADFVGSDDINWRLLYKESEPNESVITPPSSIGRYKNDYDEELIEHMTACGKVALERFGYET